MVFPADKIDEIIEAVGVWPEGGDRAALAADLEEAVGTFFVLRKWENNPSRAEQRKDFEKIAKAARRLAKALDDAPDHISQALISQANLHAERHNSKGDRSSPKTFTLKDETFVDWGGRETFRKANDSVWLLYQWSQHAIEAQRRAAKAKKVVKKIGPLFPDEDASTRLSAEHWLIGIALPEIYERYFQRKFGISKPDPKTGKPFGPGIRFIQAYLQEIGVNKSADAIEKHWKRSRQNMGQAR